MPENFEQFTQRQFPFRPDHADFTRLREVVLKVEEWKAEGRKPAEVYEELMDLYSVTYLAANRSHMDAQSRTLPITKRPDLVFVMADSWVEGFLFGLLFQEKGGHRS